ncbi:MAG: iron ABC transporter permease [Actinobacteria bacterium]|nr:iron ABC transporter permease [Actinomycetota bacterium]
MRGAWTPKNVVLGLSIALLLYLAVVPLGMLLWGSFRSAPPGVLGTFTLSNYVRAYAQPYAYTIALNTLVYSLGSTVLAVSIGTLLAWIIERTNTPLRNLLFVLSVVRITVPHMMMVIAWILLGSPQIGVINKVLQALLGLGQAPLNIYSMWGMIWVEGIDKVPIAFLLVAGALRSMDPALEEAAQVSGARMTSTFARVTVPVILPAVLASFLSVFMMAFESFEVPTLIGLRRGIHTFSSAIYVQSTSVPSDINLASTFGVAFFVIAAIGVLSYQKATAFSQRYATITGKGYRPARLDLGGWKYVTMSFSLLFLIVAFVLPLGILLWGSLLPFYSVPSIKALSRVSLENYRFMISFDIPLRAFKNSLLLGLLSATITIFITMVLAWLVVRSRRWLARLVDAVVFVPIAFPGLVLALSLMWVYLTFRIGVYGTIWILLIAYVTKYAPYGMRFSYSAMIQLQKELEEASEVHGGSWWQTIKRITVPLVLPGLISGWIYVMIYSFRETSSSILLYSSGAEVVSAIVFELWSNGQIGPASAMAETILAFLAVVVFLGRRIAARYSLEI